VIENEPAAARALIIGCGYLGTHTATALKARGCDVLATTRSDQRAAGLREAGLRVVRFDIASDRNRIEFPQAWKNLPFDAYFMLPPSTFAAVMESGAGFDRLLGELDAAPIRRALLVSSTAVYGAVHEGAVSAESSAEADDERGRRLVAIEDRWRRAGSRFRICRLAGLYGPGRVIGRRQVSNAETLPGDPEAWLNLIHIEDAAALVVACVSSEHAREIELGSDGHPVKRGDYYRYLARSLNAPQPRFDRSSAARIGSKRCDPASTMRRTGWRPRFPDFKRGLDSIFARSDEV